MIETAGMSQFDNTRYSYYRGLRWLVVLRELAFLPSTLAGAVSRAPTLEDGRSYPRQRDHRRVAVADRAAPVQGPGRRACAFGRSRRCRLVANAVDQFAAARQGRRGHRHRRDRPRQPAAGSSPSTSSTIPSPFRLRRIADSSFADRLSLKPGSFKVGFVGNLLRVKGIFELIEAARLTREQGVDAEFIIVGSDAGRSDTLLSRLLNRLRLGQDVGSEVRAKIAEYGLERSSPHGRLHGRCRAGLCLHGCPVFPVTL